MGTTPKYQIPYVEPSDTLAAFPGQNKAMADAIEAAIALPAPVDTYVAADQTITSTTASAETPTQVRASMANPHPSRRMLVLVQTNCRVVLSGSSGLGYTGPIGISGMTTAVPSTGTTTDLAGLASMQTTAIAHYWTWVPVGATQVAALAASKANTAVSMIIRYSHVSLIPIRYE